MSHVLKIEYDSDDNVSFYLDGNLMSSLSGNECEYNYMYRYENTMRRVAEICNWRIEEANLVSDV